MSKYTDFVEEFKVNSKIPNKHNFFSYLIKNAKMTDTHFKPTLNAKNVDYYTTEPTEHSSISPTTLLPRTVLPTMHTISPTSLLSYTSQCPSIKNITTFMPTIKFDNNNNNNNNNNDLIIGLTVPLSTIVFSLVIFTIYYYKYHLKYIKQRQLEIQKKEKELDLSFGLSYVDDF
jgi:hypothetical protein